VGKKERGGSEMVEINGFSFFFLSLKWDKTKFQPLLDLDFLFE